jgi:hypothetical protein
LVLETGRVDAEVPGRGDVVAETSVLAPGPPSPASLGSSGDDSLEHATAERMNGNKAATRERFENTEMDECIRDFF